MVLKLWVRMIQEMFLQFLFLDLITLAAVMGLRGGGIHCSWLKVRFCEEN